MRSNLPEAGMSVDFKAKQHEFAAYIRDPENNPPPADVKPQRMAMYRELFFNNIDSFLSANFPVLRAILDDRQWFELGQDFFVKHASRTPHFSQIPEEFLDYLQNERDSSGDFPFMLELAHYEWVEMALSIAKETVPANCQSLNDLQNQRIRLSPLAWPLAYQYPVHKISPDFLPETAPGLATFLIVYRNMDDEVNFMEITPITYRLLEIIQEQGEVLAADCMDAGGTTPRMEEVEQCMERLPRAMQGAIAEDCLKQVAEESKHPNPEMIIAGGLQILKELAGKTVITAGE